MEYGLAVGIDGSKAEAGSRVIVRSLQDISQSAESAANSVGKTESATGMLSKALDACKDAVGVAAGAFAAWKLADLARDAGLLAARVETLGVVMTAVGNNAGYAGSQMNEFAKSIAAQGITTEASRQAAVRLTQAHVDMAKASGLARIAQDAAVIANTNSSDAFDRMSTSLATGQAMIAHHMGLMVDYVGAEQRLAASLGKTKEELTQTELTQARVGEMMKAGTGIAGSYEAAMGTAGKSINSMSRFTDELKLAWGALALPSLTILVSNLTDSLKELNKATADNKSGIASTGDSMATFTTGTLTHFKKEISEVNALLLDMKSGLYLLGAVAAAPGMIAGTDLVKKMLAQSNQAAESAKAIREYAAAVKAADNGQPARDTSDVHMMAVGQMQLEAKRIAVGNAARAEEAAASLKAAAEKANEDARTLAEKQATYDKQLLDSRDALKHQYLANDRQAEDAALKARLDQLTYEKDMGLKTAQEFLDGKYTLERTSWQKELDGANAQSHTLYQAYAAVSKDPGADETMQNHALQAYIKSLGEAQKIKEKMDGATAHKPLDDLIAQVSEVNRLSAAYTNLYKNQVTDFNSLKALRDASSAAKAALVGTNATGGFDSISDQTANQLAMQQDAHEKRMKAIEDERQANINMLMDGSRSAQDYYGFISALNDKQSNEDQIDILKKKKLTTDATTTQILEAARYTSMAGQLASTLASTQDQNNRKGFESAKAFNIGAAIMSTAAAVVNQLATNPGPMGWASAALAAATGAAQVAKIDSTSFGGGSTGVSAVGSAAASSQAGNSAATSGGSMAGPTTSTQDSLSESALQSLASAADNASIAIAKVADSLSKISDILATSQNQLAINSAPGVGAHLQDPSTSLTTLFKDTLKWDWATGLGQFAVNVLTGPFKAMFGWGSSWATTGAGVQLGLANGQVTDQNYVEQTKSGGWFGSDKHRTNYSAGDPGFTKVLQEVLGQIAGKINLGAVATGTTSNISMANLAPSNIATAGKTAQQITDELNAWFTNAASAMADTVAGLKNFTAYGESSYDALIRLSTALQGVNGELNKVGASLITSSLSGADSAYNLTQLFGGTDKFTAAMDTYFTSIFTKAQQNTMTMSADTDAIKIAFDTMNAAGLNAAIPKTRDGFAALVNTITGELNSADPKVQASAQGLLQSLTSIAPAFGDLMTLTENATQALLDYNSNLQERSNTAQGLTYTEQLYKLQVDQEKQLTDARKNGMNVTALMITQQQEYSKAVSDIFKQATTDAIGIQTGLLQGLTGVLKSHLSPQDLYQSAEASYQQTKTLAETGNKQALTDLSTKANDLLAASSAYNASNAQYQADYNDVVATLSSLAGLSTTSPTLEAAQKQLSTLQAISTAMNDGNKAQLQYLSGLLTNTGIVAQYLSGYLKNLQGNGAQTAAQAVTSLNLPSFDVGSPGLPSDMAANVHRDEIILDANTSRSLQKYGIQVQSPALEAGSQGIAATNRIMDSMVTHLGAIDQNTAATVQRLEASIKVMQAGFNRSIELQTQMTADTAEIKRKARQRG